MTTHQQPATSDQEADPRHRDLDRCRL